MTAQLQSTPSRHLAFISLALGFLVIWTAVLAGVLVSRTLKDEASAKETTKVFHTHEDVGKAIFALGHELVSTIDWMLSTPDKTKADSIIVTWKITDNVMSKIKEDSIDRWVPSVISMLDTLQERLNVFRESITDTKSNPLSTVKFYLELCDWILQRCFLLDYAGQHEIKQEKWIEHIKNVIATKKLSGPLSHLLGQIIEYSNIPRKKTKFENFLKNSLKFRNPKLISEAWEIFAQSTANESKPMPNQSQTVNGTGKRTLDNEEVSNKRLCTNGVELKNTVTNSDDFRWTEVIERILLQNSQNSLSVHELRKQVLAQYKASVKNPTLPKEELKKKFKEILKNSDAFVLSKSA